ncbi:hypothetical protein [Micromonospora sp. b486]|uniref:hypothetical protein n=1 Tax=Micromonospora sp. b486 TaxID=3053986 RepID=UPI00259CD2D1|nr:hypothetical protein [Micromonospora sp. b486]MDM4784440.1 hypothetical protein [Micromonospora sp. b486]
MTSAWSFGVMPLRAAMGPPQPDWTWTARWSRHNRSFRYVVHDAVAALGGAEHVARLCRDWRALLTEESDTLAVPGRAARSATAGPPRRAGTCRCTRSARARRHPASPGPVAPRLVDLDWARGAVPTPHGPLTVDVGTEVTVESPVPVEIDVGGVRHHRPPGRWTVSAGREHDPNRPRPRGDGMTANRRARGRTHPADVANGRAGHRGRPGRAPCPRGAGRRAAVRRRRPGRTARRTRSARARRVLDAARDLVEVAARWPAGSTPGAESHERLRRPTAAPAPVQRLCWYAVVEVCDQVRRADRGRSTQYRRAT